MRRWRWRKPTSREARDGTQFLLGVTIILHELVVRGGPGEPERPTLLLVGAALIGVTILSGSGGRNGNGNGGAHG